MRTIHNLLFSVVVVLFLFVVSCGGSSTNATPSVNQPAASSSFLPLVIGITTYIEDGVLFSVNEGARTQGIVVETNNDGVAINGGFTASVGGDGLVDEQLYLQEQNGGVVLSRYDTIMFDGDGTNPSNTTINFNPAVVILQDRENMAVGDVYTTANVDVTYSGDITNHHYIPSQTVVPDDLVGATVAVEVVDSRDITIEGVTVTAYRLMMIDVNELPSVFSQSPFFTNMFSYSWMSFWLAKGIGIVGLSEAFATSTTANMPAP